MDYENRLALLAATGPGSGAVGLPWRPPPQSGGQQVGYPATRPLGLQLRTRPMMLTTWRISAPERPRTLNVPVGDVVPSVGSNNIVPTFADKATA